MKRHTLITAVIMLSLTVSPGWSQEEDQDQRPDKRQHRPVPPLIRALDVNRDGELDQDEIADASHSLLTLDKNEDGILSREELRPPCPPPPRGEGRKPEKPNEESEPE